jgi:hypothetical protein
VSRLHDYEGDAFEIGFESAVGESGWKDKRNSPCPRIGLLSFLEVISGFAQNSVKKVGHLMSITNKRVASLMKDESLCQEFYSAFGYKVIRRESAIKQHINFHEIEGYAPADLANAAIRNADDHDRFIVLYLERDNANPNADRLAQLEEAYRQQKREVIPLEEKVKAHEQVSIGGAVTLTVFGALLSLFFIIYIFAALSDSKIPPATIAALLPLAFITALPMLVGGILLIVFRSKKRRNKATPEDEQAYEKALADLQSILDEATALSNQPIPAAAPAATPVAQPANPAQEPNGIEAKLKQLQDLKDKGLITAEEYETKRKALIASL